MSLEYNINCLRDLLQTASSATLHYANMLIDDI